MENNPNHTILTIEDDAVVRRSIVEYLKDHGFNVLEAENGRTGLEQLRSNEPELILLDLRMPEMDGLEALEIITKESPGIPVIIISGTGRIEDAVEALRLGASDYLIKPIVDMEILLHTIRKTTERIRLVRKNQEYKQNLEAIFMSIEDAIIMVDKDFRVVEYNKAARKICGFSEKSDVKGKRYGSFMNNCTGQCLDALKETIGTKLPAERTRFECGSGTGSGRVFSTATYPFFDAGDKFNGCVITVKDETRLDELESDLRERLQFKNIIGKCNEMQKIYSLIEVLSKHKRMF